jgi:hypothetical protein
MSRRSSKGFIRPVHTQHQDEFAGKAGVREATAKGVNVYNQERAGDLHQHERTGRGLIEIAFAADEMLKLIDELSKNDA